MNDVFLARRQAQKRLQTCNVSNCSYLAKLATSYAQTFKPEEPSSPRSLQARGAFKPELEGSIHLQESSVGIEWWKSNSVRLKVWKWKPEALISLIFAGIEILLLAPEFWWWGWWWGWKQTWGWFDGWSQINVLLVVRGSNRSSLWQINDALGQLGLI